MLIVKAEHMGQCFGVKDALEVARTVEDPTETSIFGELVHNPQIQEELESRGFLQLSELERGTASLRPQVLITAHGVSDAVRSRLKSAGRKVIDTTCPLVRRVHKTALHYHKRGYFLIVLGRAGHVEVEGLVGDLERFSVVEHLSQVQAWAFDKIAVVNQTTMPPGVVDRFHEEIAQKNRGRRIEFADTVCRPTRDRQEAVERLLGRVQAVVVVGGKNSNNTRQLGLRAEQRGLPWIHVQGPEDLEPDWFRDYRLVGLTAGTSTPEDVIDKVYHRLREIGTQLLKVRQGSPSPRERRKFVRNEDALHREKIGA